MKALDVVLAVSTASLIVACSPMKFEAVKSAPSGDAFSIDPVVPVAPFPSEPATPISTPVPTPVPAPSPAATPVATPVPVPTPVPTQKAMESFYQDDSANKVDILVIADNSQSMDAEQSKMSQRFSSFTSAIRDIDYQIGVTTTDLSGGRFSSNGNLVDYEGTRLKILTPSTPNAAELFRQTVARKETVGCAYREVDPECPSTNEEPLRAIMTAMDKRFSSNVGFFRDKVDFVVVVLSDEDEQSTGPAAATKPQEVIRHFQATFGQSKRLAVHGIIIKPGDSACRSQQRGQLLFGAGGEYGTHVNELAGLTGGTVQSICDADYSSSLSTISQSVRKLVGSFELQAEPAAGSLSVRLTPDRAINYRIEGKRVIFDTPPPAGTRIDISYDLK
jgi:hypothetical protein